jgi:hypothetical protein
MIRVRSPRPARRLRRKTRRSDGDGRWSPPQASRRAARLASTLVTIHRRWRISASWPTSRTTAVMVCRRPGPPGPVGRVVREIHRASHHNQLCPIGPNGSYPAGCLASKEEGITPVALSCAVLATVSASLKEVARSHFSARQSRSRVRKVVF